MRVITLLCLSLFSFLLLVQPNVAGAEEQQRPRIGLVLGGGGAAGVAHVGVLKILEEHGVPIDYIAGTSMGAIVGGLYASGMSAKELESVVGQLDWIGLFDDEPERELRSYRSKSDLAEFVGSLEVGFDKKGVNVERGAVLGQRLTFELRRLLEHVSHIRDFDKLPIPFRAVATDIENGKEVVLKEGNLATALRASMSIPGMFPPVTLNDQLLVDGFVSNNVPTHVAREMGADILIVVDIPTELKKKDELDSALSISLQTMKLLMAFTSQHVKKLTAPDIVIEPDMQEIGPLNFDRVGETIEIGFKAARQHDAQLQALVERVGKRTVHIKTPRKVESKKIDKILVENTSVLDDRLIIEKLGLKEGEVLDFEKLQEGLARVYGLGYFETVDYRIKNEGEQSILMINAQADPTGNNRLRLGFTLEDDFGGDALYRIGTSFIKRGLFSSNSEFKLDLVVGSTFTLAAELYQPLRSNSQWFIKPRLWTTKQNLHQYEEDQRLREFRVTQTGAEFEFGYGLDTWGQLSSSLLYEYATPKIRVGQAPENLADIETIAITARFNVDTVDNPRFPSDGHALNTEILHASKDLGADTDYTRLQIEGLKAWHKDKHRWIATAGYGTSLEGDLPLSQRFSLGGFTRLSGLNRDQINGQHYALLGGVYLYELGNFYDMARLFVGTSLEIGNTWEKHDDIDWDTSIVSGSAFISADTPLGPLYLGFGKTDRQETSAFLYLGFPFR